MKKKNKIKSYRILNLEGAWFDFTELEKNKFKFTFSTTEDKTFLNKKNKEVITIKSDKDKLYTATMPYSLETDRAFTKYPDEVLNEDLKVADEEYIKDDKKELFTNLFVNFKFTKDLFQDETEEIEKSELEKEIGNENEIITEETQQAKETKRINKKKVRKLIYTSTVEIDGIIYSFYKRGASKARTANVIFCKADLCDELLKPSLLGLKFKEGQKYDLTSKEAYTSLIMSGIIGKINITRDQILIINDITGKEFKARQTKTIMIDGKVIQDEGENNEGFWVSNNTTDGQGMMDESIFLENELLNEATCALLRNDFLKCNALRTKLQEYYSKNKITKVWDMFRGWVDASTIRLVITPSSCKFLKFADNELFGGDDIKCYEHWRTNIPEEFGVVKTDHVGNYEFSNRLAYQFWNSMNLNRLEVAELMQDELDYFKLLKDNTLVDSEKLSKLNAKNKKFFREKRNEMSYFLKSIKTSEEDLETSDMVIKLLDKNIDFRFTRKFKDWKNEQLQDYIDNLRLGKTRIQNSIYAIMISCPYEMLVATTKENNKIDNSIMTGWECWNPHYTEGTEFLAIRNPQINEGNIAYMVNKYHEQYKWFGYQVKDEDGKMKNKHDFVVFVNSYNVDIMNRLQGCDWDIDTCYLSDHKLLVQKAKESQEYATPVNGIEGKPEAREYSEESLSDLDNYLGGSTRSIGKVVNKSAIFNGYMYHAINTEEYNEDYINKCYEASSTLSSCSQISIDMAKKNFNDDDGKKLSLTKIMNQLNKQTYITDENKEERILRYKIDRENSIKVKLSTYLKDLLKQEDENHEIQYELVKPIDMTNKLKEYQEDMKIFKNLSDEDKQIIKQKYNTEIEVYAKKMIVPRFFKFIAKDNSYRIPTPFECGMDYLEEILDNLKTKAMETKVVNISDLLIMQKELSGGAYCGSKIDEVRKIISNCDNVINSNRCDPNDNKEEKKRKNNIKKWSKKKAIKELQDQQLNEKTVLRILMRAFNIDDSYKGQEIKILNKKGDIIKYKTKAGAEKVLVYKELKEMTMLVLTLMYNAYPELFIKCFKDKKTELSELEEIEEYWM